MLTENQIYKKITIVIVLYNSTNLVLECFKSIKNLFKNVGIYIIIVLANISGMFKSDDEING